MSAPAKWIPGDDELDGLARSLPPTERDRERVEDARTAVLAAAAGVSQLPRRSAKPFFIAGGAALAAAAAAIIWLVARPSETPAARKENIAAIGVARFHTVTEWPDYTVELDDGEIAIEVAALATDEHFVVRARDGEVEVRGTKFVVGAESGKLRFVAVSEGRVELRRATEPAVFLVAGQSWKPTITAVRDELPKPEPTTIPSRAPRAEASAQPNAPSAVGPSTASSQPSAPAPSKRVTTSPNASSTTRTVEAPSKRVTSNPTPSSGAQTAEPTSPPAAAPTPAPGPAVATPPPVAAKPGELEFKNGVASLRAGDAGAAVKSFAAACTAARGDALDEDACFWLGAAARRAGQAATARAALTSFVQRFPKSARVGEASALLGWILYDAGELDAAEARFRVAASDRVPKVKESAERGLGAIDRKRGK